jgi:glycosyltransferase involved in cell wall biosynthesis
MRAVSALLKTNNPMPAQKLPVSVCMISGSEAHRIRRTLESVAGWTHEVVIMLNEEVSDGTDRIAAEFGAKIFREPWKGYVAQKNSAAQKAGQEWILSLDADEEISSALREEIIAIFATGSPDSLTAAWSFPRCSFYGGRWIRHGDWYPDRKIRLWRRGKAEWRGQNVHETLIVNGNVGKLKSDLLHYTMENLNDHLRKSTLYSDLFAKQHIEAGRNANALDLWFRPWWRFMRGYFLRRGFLDGWQGYTIARMVAFETFLRYAKVRAAQTSKGEHFSKL